jgi:hypothetical protein
VLVAAAIGCASEEAPTSKKRELPAVDAPDSSQTAAAKLEDIKFEFDATVPAGDELFKCRFGAFPSDRGVIAVPSAESHYTPGSHHLLVYRTDLTSIPDDLPESWNCEDVKWFANVRGTYYEAQQPNEMRHLPEGIAHEFQPGEIVVMESHYINATEEDIDAHVELTLHTMDVRDVTDEAGSIFFNNVNIMVPPHANTSASMTCPISQDIHLALLWSHMHERGVRFQVTTDDPDAADALGPLLDEEDWSEPKAREYPGGDAYVLHAGSHISTTCDYENDTDAAFVFGTSAKTNEMCILHGMYWPRMASADEQCFTNRVTSRSSR